MHYVVRIAFSILLVPAFIVVVLLEKTKAKKVTDMFPIFETPVVTPRSTAKHQLSQSAPPPATPELPVSKP